MHHIRRLYLCLLVLLLAPATAVIAQNYTTVVVFGDSLSDTGNVTHLTKAQFGVAVPGPVPSNYTLGRFTDGKDTLPPATLYTGVWIEQLTAAMPGAPAVKNSLDGGTNYAYGYATTGAGTGTLDLTTGVSVNVENVGQQILDYLATNPTITNKTLFVIWGGAIDLLHATSASDVTTAAANEAAAVQTLINKGATQFLIPNLPPLGLIPRTNGNAATSAQANAASLGFNQALAVGLANVGAANTAKGVHIFTLDTYTLFNNIVANAAANGLSNTTGSSQGNAVNPDTFLFWDDLHPTTTGHHLVANAAAGVLATGFTTTTTLTATPTTVGVGNTLTLTANVSSPGGQPSGTVTFYDGTTSLGTASLGTGTTATSAVATFTTTALTAGMHSLTAAFAAGGGFPASTSAAVSVTVVTPMLSVGGTANLSIPVGSNSTSGTFTLTSVGSFASSVAIACGTQPANFSCSVTPATLDLSDGAAHSFTANISVSGSAALAVPARPGSRLLPTIATAGLLPLLGMLSLSRRRRRSFIPILLLLLLSLGTTLGLSGCGGGSANTVSPGTYTVPLIFTPAGKSALPAYNITVTYHPFL